MKRQANTKASNRSADKPKRGPGRPRLPNALTPAQRAKRYRDRKRQRLNDAAATPNKRATENEGAVSLAQAQRLSAENARLAAELKAAQGRIADLRSMVEMFIEARMKKKTIPADVFRNLCESYLKL